MQAVHSHSRPSRIPSIRQKIPSAGSIGSDALLLYIARSLSIPRKGSLDSSIPVMAIGVRTTTVVHERQAIPQSPIPLERVPCTSAIQIDTSPSFLLCFLHAQAVIVNFFVKLKPKLYFVTLMQSWSHQQVLNWLLIRLPLACSALLYHVLDT